MEEVLFCLSTNHNRCKAVVSGTMVVQSDFVGNMFLIKSKLHKSMSIILIQLLIVYVSTFSDLEEWAARIMAAVSSVPLASALV